MFLTLARQAGSFRDATALPAWLHRVAIRTARKVLDRRDPAVPLPDAIPDPSDSLAGVAWKDVRRVLDEELDALPTHTCTGVGVAILASRDRESGISE